MTLWDINKQLTSEVMVVYESAWGDIAVINPIDGSISIKYVPENGGHLPINDNPVITSSLTECFDLLIEKEKERK